MARRGARGKGWIRLMRIITWVLAALMLLAGILAGIAVMNASGSTQTSVGQIPTAQNNGATFYLTVEGTGGGFSYYELGAPLFKDDNNLNEDVGEEEIRKYVYYMETKKPLETKISDSRYYLGKNNDTAYYFYYKKDEITTLNHEFLSTINTKATEYVFYADKCSLSQEIMKKFNITFKKIPRDITRL